MIDILIIADDFTGALDTGVQFASTGIRTVVRTGDDSDFNKLSEEGIQILVLDTETRHLSPDRAYETVFHITKKAVQSGVRHIYKKTDSALRGNIGSELTALLDGASSNTLPFIPALPHMNRITRGGIHYIDGKPVEDSVFGSDPFEPVTHSYIPDIISLQSNIRTLVLGADEAEETESLIKEIHIYDVESEAHLQKIASRLFHKNQLPIMAGCSGFASVLPGLFDLKGSRKKVKFSNGGMLVVNGSLNPITNKQLDYAETCSGFYREILTPEQKLEADHWKTPQGMAEGKAILQRCRMKGHFIIDGRDKDGSSVTNKYAAEKLMDADRVRKQITVSLGQLVRYLMENDLHHTLMVIGGDTLQSVLRELDVCEMRPICEIFPGTVLSSFCFRGQDYQLISKSGGFGRQSLLGDISEIVSEDNRKGKEYG